VVQGVTVDEVTGADPFWFGLMKIVANQERMLFGGFRADFSSDDFCPCEFVEPSNFLAGSGAMANAEFHLGIMTK